MVEGSALKISRREVPGSIPSRSYRPSRSEFSVVFSETRIDTYLLGFLRKTRTEGIPPIVPGPTSGQLDLRSQPTNHKSLRKID